MGRAAPRDGIAPARPGVKLGFDASSLTADGKGLARFQGEVLGTLAGLGLVEELTVFVPDPAAAALPRVEGWRYLPARTRPMILWEQFRLPSAARREGIDILITTSERAALWGPPQVVYIYEHPRHRTRRAREAGATLRQRLVNTTTSVLFALAMRRAARVAAASSATALDLAFVPGVRVIPSAANERFRPDDARSAASRAELGAPDGYFLHLASDDPRDNSAVVVDALGVLAADGVRPVLVVGGPVAALRAGLEARARAAGVGDQIRWVGFRADDGLADLYRGALAYVDPSLYEGFGLQALEALACGTPAIASNTTSLPEVVGDGGVLLDPHDARGFAQAMRRALDEPEWLAQLRGRALAHAATFTWERTARELLALCAETRPEA